MHLLVDILRSFCGMSGLKINLEKNALLGINYEEEVEVLVDEIGCGREIWPINYLDVTLGVNPLKVSLWEPVLSKTSRKLASWKKTFLSKGGD